MTEATPDPRIDRLYRLLPMVYRMRDADQGYKLQGLLRVMAEQVNAVEDGISQQYDDWFIETAADWVVPYIGDLVGFVPSPEAGLPASADTSEGRLRDRWLVPRREVANTVRFRRRKGTLGVLDQLAADIAEWPARAVEFYRLLGWNQNINHLHLHRARLADLRDMEALDLLDGPFDRMAHSVDVRRIDSHRTLGRTNIPSVGVFVWRLKSYSVTYTPAHCDEEVGPHCFTFSVLGQDAPLFIRPNRELRAPPEDELGLPAPIRRLAFEKTPGLYYGPGRSLSIWAEDWAGIEGDQPVPLANIVPADLSGWHYVPPARHIAVDPVLGRIAFPPSQIPRKGVRVTYQYGFSADIGGGEYRRVLSDPAPRMVRVADPDHPGQTILQPSEPKTYRVGRGDGLYHRIADAIAAWRQDMPWDAVIELTESGVFVEPLQFDIGNDRTLELRAANGARPVLRLLDWQTDVPDSLSVTMGDGSRFTMDGLMVTGRGVQVSGPEGDAPPPAPGSGPFCASQLVIRHCTLVPGWGIDCDCMPDRPAEPSLELSGLRCAVAIEHSILGSILVQEDEVRRDPIPIRIGDSIVDAAMPGNSAICGIEDRPAHAAVTILRCTVFGIVDVHSVPLAENSIFNDCVHVARRQIGCMRFCYVPPGCRTPRRTSCQPDLVVAAVKAAVTDPVAQAADILVEQVRVRPVFGSIRYGRPDYAQLSADCAVEIVRGADDESEMGVFHDLFQPLREANLLARLEEFTPAGSDVGIIHVT